MSMTRREFTLLSASVTAVLVTGCKRRKLRLRKEVNALSVAELASFRAGVDAMQQLARDNPASWDYQRAVHSIPTPNSGNGLPADPPGVANYWRKCKHHTAHFFDWHRWELFYFEEFCRQLSGDTKFNLPYWTTCVDAHLPVAFRPPASGTNVLFHARNAALNAGTGELNGISPSGMSELDLPSFQSDFEFDPHDLVHGAIGFDMGSVPTAALDPVFYVHHCNIDRYWQEWLKQGGGRVNPTGAWAATTHDFQSVSGPKTPTAAGADTPEKMGYTYDPPKRHPRYDVIVDLLKALRQRYRFKPPKPIPPPPPEAGPDGWRALAATEGLDLDGVPTVVPVPLSADSAKAVIDAFARKEFEAALTLTNLAPTELAMQGGFFYKVYLVPSARELADGKLKQAVELGSISTFSISAVSHADHAGHQGPNKYVILLKEPARAMIARAADKDPAFVFVRRGLLINGKEDESGMDQVLFRFEDLRIEVRSVAQAR